VFAQARSRTLGAPAFTHGKVDDFGEPGARVAVELSRASARALAEQILRCLDAADAYERA
jgi:hypothetical protein